LNVNPKGGALILANLKKKAAGLTEKSLDTLLEKTQEDQEENDEDGYEESDSEEEIDEELMNRDDCDDDYNDN